MIGDHTTINTVLENFKAATEKFPKCVETWALYAQVMNDQQVQLLYNIILKDEEENLCTFTDQPVQEGVQIVSAPFNNRFKRFFQC